MIFNELESSNSFVNRNEKPIKIEQIWSKFDKKNFAKRFPKCGRNKKIERCYINKI